MPFGPFKTQDGNFNAIFFGTGPPLVAGDGAFKAGDRVNNTAPGASGALYWVCTAGGTPGTWVPFPNATVRSSTDASAVTGSDLLVISNTAGGIVTKVFPAPAGLTGKTLELKRTGANNAVFTAAAIDGGTTITLATDKAGCMIRSDGTQWWVIAGFGTVTIT